VLLSTAISSSLVGGYLLVGLFRESGMRFSGATARALAQFGAPIVVWELGSFVLHFSDRYFLRGYHSLAVVGVYSLSYKLAQIIPFLVTGPFSGIWLPKALEIEKREGPGAVPILAAILRHYNLVLIAVSLGMALFAGDVIRLVTGAGFHDADRPIPVLALAMVFFGYRQVAQIGALIKDRPGLVARSTIIAAAGVVAFNLLLIPRYGMMGAAVATLAGFALEFSIMRWHSMRVYALRIEYGLGPIALAALAWLGAEVAFPGGRTPLLLSVTGRFAAFAVFAGALILTGIITPDQRRFLTAALRHPVRSVQALRGA
jgi:O-antigen/teichoic acid export membrane protein